MSELIDTEAAWPDLAGVITIGVCIDKGAPTGHVATVKLDALDLDDFAAGEYRRRDHTGPLIVAFF